MNRDQAKGTWAQLKGKAKVLWGELLNDEDLKAEGSVDKLYGFVQKRFGSAKQQLKTRIDKVRMP